MTDQTMTEITNMKMIHVTIKNMLVIMMTNMAIKNEMNIPFIAPL